jgi:phosphoglycolate phosphatase/pyrophosphatase PpaX
VQTLFRDEIGMSEEEMAAEEQYWANYVEGHIPTAFSGMRELLCEFVARGGIIVVDSHSLTRYIERDWKTNALPTPAHIYGWDIPKENRKPSPFTVLDALERFSLKKEDVLVVDDLKPGFDMARGAGVSFAAAGWAYDVAEIEGFMRAHCDFYLKSVSELRELIFGGEK